jgi:microcystin-dependent protein
MPGANLGDLPTDQPPPYAASMPVGTILSFGGATVPTNYLLCDGAEISRTTYAALFAVCGTAYGAGDGQFTFRLPDLRGRVPMGEDGAAARINYFADARGQPIWGAADAGVEKHALSVAELPSHEHQLIQPAWLNATFVGSSYGAWNAGGGAGADGGGGSTAAGSSQTHNNMQPYQVVKYIIRAVAPTPEP